MQLRLVSDADLPVLGAQLADPSVAQWWVAYDEARLRREVAAAPGDHYAVVDGGEVVGLVVLSEEHDPEYRAGAVDLFLGPPAQGRGLGRRVVAEACRLLVEERGHHRVTIDPAADNARAVACYAAVGFREVGRLRQAQRAPDDTWRDGLLMDLLAPELRR